MSCLPEKDGGEKLGKGYRTKKREGRPRIIVKKVQSQNKTEFLLGWKKGGMRFSLV